MSGYQAFSDDSIREVWGTDFAKRERKCKAVDVPVIVFITAQTGVGKSAAAAQMVRKELRCVCG